MKHLFLRWCLSNLVTLTILLAAMAYLYPQAQALSAIGKIIVCAIFAVYVIAACYAGVLSWRTDCSCERLEKSKGEGRSDHRRRLANLNHKAEHIAFAANVAPYIGLLGAATGIFIFMTGTSGAQDLTHIKEVLSSAQAGIGVAFAPTIVGIFFMISLSWQHHMVQNGIGFALKDYYQLEKNS